MLDGLEVLQICVGYRLSKEGGGSKVSENPPLFTDAFADVEPVYEEMPGWKESTIGITSFDELPKNARAYIERLQQLTGVPIDIISTGPDRDQTIVLRHPCE